MSDYRPYFPNFLNKLDNIPELVKELSEEPFYRLAIFCTDVCNSFPSKVATDYLSAISNEFLAYDVSFDSKNESMLDLLNKADSDLSDESVNVWKEIANTLYSSGSRTMLVIFCSNIYQSREKFDALLQSGMLAGALSEHELPS